MKQASPASFVRPACVPKGSTASNVTSGAPATWTTLIGECQLPREKHCLLKLNLECPRLGKNGLSLTEVVKLKDILFFT